MREVENADEVINKTQKIAYITFITYKVELCNYYIIRYNFVLQLTTWQVVIDKGISVDHMEIHFYQSQLII